MANYVPFYVSMESKAGNFSILGYGINSKSREFNAG